MSRNDEVDRTWPRSTLHEHLQDDTERRCGCQDGRPRSVACEPLQDATMRSRRLTQAIAGSDDEVGRTADPPSKLKTWTEDTTMTEDKQCLQRVERDTTEGRCLEEGCGKNMRDVCCDLTPYETSRWLELKPDRENATRSGTCSITHGTIATQREYIVMVKTGYECQPEPTCRHTAAMLLWSVARKCCFSQVSSCGVQHVAYSA